MKVAACYVRAWPIAGTCLAITSAFMNYLKNGRVPKTFQKCIHSEANIRLFSLYGIKQLLSRQEYSPVQLSAPINVRPRLWGDRTSPPHRGNL